MMKVKTKRRLLHDNVVDTQHIPLNSLGIGQDSEEQPATSKVSIIITSIHYLRVNNTCTCTYKYIHTYMYIHVYAYIHIYIHSYTAFPAKCVKRVVRRALTVYRKPHPQLFT